MIGNGDGLYALAAKDIFLQLGYYPELAAFVSFFEIYHDSILFIAADSLMIC